MLIDIPPPREDRIVRVEPKNGFTGYNADLNTMQVISDHGRVYEGVYEHLYGSRFRRWSEEECKFMNFDRAYREKPSMLIDHVHYIPFRMPFHGRWTQLWFKCL